MVYLMLADGFEIVEAMTPVDVLRRTQIPVATVGITGMNVKSSQNVIVQADISLEEVVLEDMQMIILPGGLVGTQNLKQNKKVQQFIQYCAEHNRYIAAICAAPSIVLGDTGLLQGKEATCYPGMEDGMIGAVPQAKSCCMAERVITGRAAGASMDFALTLCAVLADQKTADAVAQSICYDR